MSGIDERKSLLGLGYCPACGRNILTWEIKSSVLQRHLTMYNCTDMFGGPDYALDGLFSDIEYFKCGRCKHIFERDTSKYRLLLRGIKRVPHIRDNLNRNETVRAVYER
jgi:DNA-directed RNA polymerase subunit RPC12/RpoP